MRGILEQSNILELKQKIAKTKLLGIKCNVRTSEMQADTYIRGLKNGYFAYVVPSLFYNNRSNYTYTGEKILSWGTTFDDLIESLSEYNFKLTSSVEDSLSLGSLVVRTVEMKNFNKPDKFIVGVVDTSVVFIFYIMTDGKTFKLNKLSVVDDTLLRIDFTLKRARHELYLSLENYEFNYKG